MKLFPNLLHRSCLEDLSHDEITWILLQQYIDQGLVLCEKCGEFSFGRYCRDCGTELIFGKIIYHCTNQKCGAEYSNKINFCESCGTQIDIQALNDYEEIKRKLIDGSLDLSEYNTPEMPEHEQARLALLRDRIPMEDFAFKNGKILIKGRQMPILPDDILLQFTR